MNSRIDCLLRDSPRRKKLCGIVVCKISRSLVSVVGTRCFSDTSVWFLKPRGPRLEVVEWKSVPLHWICVFVSNIFFPRSFFSFSFHAFHSLRVFALPQLADDSSSKNYVRSGSFRVATAPRRLQVRRSRSECMTGKNRDAPGPRRFLMLFDPTRLDKFYKRTAKVNSQYAQKCFCPVRRS